MVPGSRYPSFEVQLIRSQLGNFLLICRVGWHWNRVLSKNAAQAGQSASLGVLHASGAWMSQYIEGKSESADSGKECLSLSYRNQRDEHWAR